MLLKNIKTISDFRSSQQVEARLLYNIVAKIEHLFKITHFGIEVFVFFF